MDPRLVSTASLDSLFAALAQPRRRQVLAVTGERDGPTAVDELARSIARTEHERRPEEPPAASVASVATTLHHVHLPRLADAGLLAYDDVVEAVARTDGGRRSESVVAVALGVHDGGSSG